MKILIIDDELVRKPKLVQFIKERTGCSDDEILQITDFDLHLLNQADIIFLDNDLGTGTDVYDHIKQHVDNINFEGKFFFVHSANPVAARNICSLLNDYTLQHRQRSILMM